MLKSSSVQVLFASVVPVSIGANAMVGTQNSSISDIRCAYPSCARAARHCTSKPHSRSRPHKSSPNITVSSPVCSARTTTTSRPRTTLSGSTKWLLIATLVMVAFLGLFPFSTAVSTVEAAPMPTAPTHPSFCPDELHCNFACQMGGNFGGNCVGPSDNVCVCYGTAPVYGKV